MSLEPLLTAHWIIQLHTYAALAALVIGLVQIAGPKGTLPHKTIGVVWVVLMLTIAISSIFLRPLLFPGIPIWQWFNWIHIFTLVTFWLVGEGIYHLVRGGPAFKKHAGSFISIFIGGLIIAGAFTFLPGRLMHKVLFGS